MFETERKQLPKQLEKAQEKPCEHEEQRLGFGFGFGFGLGLELEAGAKLAFLRRLLLIVVSGDVGVCVV